MASCEKCGRTYGGLSAVGTCPECMNPAPLAIPSTVGSAKDQFEYSIRNMIEREMRRRKTGRIHVLHHVVRVVNELNTLPDHHWRMVPNH